MTPFLETGSVVRALDTLEVMALDKSVTLKHQEYLYRLFCPLHVMGINQIWGHSGLRFFAHITKHTPLSSPSKYPETFSFLNP